MNSATLKNLTSNASTLLRRCCALMLCLGLIALHPPGASAGEASYVWDSASAGPSVLRFAILKTAELRTREGLTYAQGELGKTIVLNHVAVLIEHGQDRVLFDTGLGERIDQQYLDDMPWWGKLLFSYTKTQSAKAQLARAGLPDPARIVLSHAHWDHASGVVDFPDAAVLAPAVEAQFSTQSRFGVFPSQFAFAASRWQALVFTDAPVAGYQGSHDLFGDGSALLVPMPGHTPGSVGLLLRTRSGGRFFFVGDTVWNANAIAQVSPKFWLARSTVDFDSTQTLEQIRHLHDFQRDNPEVILVPAHDAAVHDRLGYFPQWVE